MLKRKKIDCEVELLSQVLPEDWRVIKARTSNGKSEVSLILSPHGRKFYSLETARDFMEEEKMKKKKRMPKEDKIQRTYFDADGSPVLSQAAKIKRKRIAEKNNFGKMRNAILERNQKLKNSQNKKKRKIAVSIKKSQGSPRGSRAAGL